MSIRKHRSWQTSVAVGIALSTLSGVADAGGAESVISACYRKRNGTLRIVAEGKSCKRNEERLTWNQRGPAGDRGPQGPPGTPGSSGTPTSDAYSKSESDDRFQQRCHNGTVGGFAWILGADGSYDLSTIPTTFTAAPVFISYNCNGQPIMVKRDAVGQYVVAFTGHGGSVRLAVANVDTSYGRNDAFANAGIAVNYNDVGPGVPVVIRDHTGAFVDTPFTVFVLDGLPGS